VRGNVAGLGEGAEIVLVVDFGGMGSGNQHLIFHDLRRAIGDGSRRGMVWYEGVRRSSWWLSDGRLERGNY
jgi:hypothetical protein